MKENNMTLHMWFGYLLVLYAVVSPVSISATNIALGLVILVGLVILYKEGKLRNIVIDRKLTVLWLSLFAWAGFTALITKGYIVKTDISNIWEYSTVVLLPLFLLIIKTRKERVVLTLLIFSSIVCLLGIYQDFVPSVTYPFPRQLVRAEQFHGFFGNRLHTSGFYSIVTILSFSLVLFWRCEKRKKMFLWLFFILNIAAIIISMSRSYYISVAMILLILLFARGWRTLIFGCIALSVFFAITFSFPNKIHNRMNSLFDTQLISNTYRIFMWKTALKMSKGRPVVGSGAGNWEKVAVEHYYPLVAKEMGFTIPAFGHPHNTYLTWLSECGIIGLLLFLSFWGLVVRRLLAVKSKLQKGSFDYALTVGTLASLGNLFIAGLFEHNFGTSVILLLICFLIGMSLGTEKEPRSNATHG